MFKVGDVVECDTPGGYIDGRLSKGTKYIVKEINKGPSSDLIEVIGDNKSTLQIYPFRFILASQAQQQAAPQQVTTGQSGIGQQMTMTYNPGDYVETLQDHFYNSGQTVRQIPKGTTLKVNSVQNIFGAQALFVDTTLWLSVKEIQINHYDVKPASYHYKNIYSTGNPVYTVPVPTGINFGQMQVDLNGAVTFPNMTKTCIHEMIDYIGFTQRYKYCKKCDHKET